MCLLTLATTSSPLSYLSSLWAACKDCSLDTLARVPKMAVIRPCLAPVSDRGKEATTLGHTKHMHPAVLEESCQRNVAPKICKNLIGIFPELFCRQWDGSLFGDNMGTPAPLGSHAATCYAMLLGPCIPPAQTSEIAVCTYVPPTLLFEVLCRRQ